MVGPMFDPYHKWLGIVAEDQPPNHYRLLGVDLFESDADVISYAADQRMLHIRTFQAGEHSTLSQRILNEISRARVCLLDAEKKGAYDASLSGQLELEEAPNEDVNSATGPGRPAAGPAFLRPRHSSLPSVRLN